MDTNETEVVVKISLTLAKRILGEIDGGRSGQDEERELKAAIEQAEAEASNG